MKYYFLPLLKLQTIVLSPYCKGLEVCSSTCNVVSLSLGRRLLLMLLNAICPPMMLLLVTPWIIFILRFLHKIQVVAMHSLYTSSYEISLENHQLKVEQLSLENELGYAKSFINHLVVELQKTHKKHFDNGFRHYQTMGTTLYPKMDFSNIPYFDEGLAHNDPVNWVCY